MGRNNWLFAGNLRASKRAATIVCLLQLAKFNGHDVYTHMKDVLERLPALPNICIAELMPYRWQLAA